MFARLLGPTVLGDFYFSLAVVYVLTNPLRGMSMGLENRVSEAVVSSRGTLGGILHVPIAGYILLAPGLYVVGEMQVTKPVSPTL